MRHLFRSLVVLNVLSWIIFACIASAYEPSLDPSAPVAPDPEAIAKGIECPAKVWWDARFNRSGTQTNRCRIAKGEEGAGRFTWNLCCGIWPMPERFGCPNTRWDSEAKRCRDIDSGRWAESLCCGR